MKYIDLSYDIKNEMPVYPGDMELNLSKEKDYDEDEFNLYTVSTSMHVGTHIDAPLHMCKNKKFISEYSQKETKRIVIFVSHQVELTRQFVDGEIIFSKGEFPKYEVSMKQYI